MVLVLLDILGDALSSTAKDSSPPVPAPRCCSCCCREQQQCAGGSDCARDEYDNDYWQQHR